MGGACVFEPAPISRIHRVLEKLHEETVEEQAPAVRNIALVERRILLVVPTTVIATLQTALTLGLLRRADGAPVAEA